MNTRVRSSKYMHLLDLCQSTAGSTVSLNQLVANSVLKYKPGNTLGIMSIGQKIFKYDSLQPSGQPFECPLYAYRQRNETLEKRVYPGEKSLNVTFHQCPHYLLLKNYM